MADAARRRRGAARLVLLGTAGGPTAYADRAGVSSAVAVGDAFYLVDLGHGALRQAVKAGLGTGTGPAARPLTGLSGVFRTHMHSDHLAEFSSLIINGMWNGITNPSAPVPIYGPGDRGGLPPVLGDRPTPPVIAPDDPTPGTVTMTRRAIEAFAQDLNERLRGSGGVDPGAAFAPYDIPLPSGVDAPVDAAPMPRISPFLVHEVIDRAWAEARYPEPRTPAQEATLKHLLESHTTIEDVGPVADSAGAGTLVLNHLVPGEGPVPQYRRAGRGFSGRLVVGTDLDEIPLGR